MDGSGYDDVLDFTGSNGSNPYSFGEMTLVNSTIYGTTVYGGNNNDGTVFALQTAPMPEPGSLALLAAGAVAMIGYCWQRRRAARSTKKPAYFGKQHAPAILSFPRRSTWQSACVDGLLQNTLQNPCKACYSLVAYGYRGE